MAYADYELGEQNFEIPSLQAHICQYSVTGRYVPVTRSRVLGIVTLQANFFGVPSVCL